MGRKRFEILLKGWLSDELTEEEINELLQTIHLPEFEQQLDVVAKNEFINGVYSEKSLSEEKSAVFKRLKQRIKDQEYNSDEFIQTWNEESSEGHKEKLFSKKYSGRIYHLAKVSAVAAFIILIVGVMFFYLRSDFSTNRNITLVNLIETKNGSRINTTLPDGSKVWVNSGSNLTYDKNFGKGLREVILEGEAYFDVRKDEGRPFIVHTKTVDVKVLGTKFNVRAYKTEASTEATLISGIVEVALKKKNNEKITLKPNEKIIVQNDGPLHPQPNDSDKASTPKIVLSVIKSALPNSEAVEVQWTQNKLVFDQEKLEDIIPVLERWYDVNIHLDFKPDPNRKVSGKYENDSLKDVLESLKLTGGFNYKIEKSEVTIYQ